MSIIVFLGVLLLAAYFILMIVVVSSFKKSPAGYRPMLLYFISSFLLEALIIIFGYDSQVTRILITIQALFAIILVSWQARAWGLFRNLSYYKGLMLFMLGIWIIELAFKQPEKNEIPWFSVVYAFAIVLIGIELLKRQPMNVNIRLVNNPIALFSIGLIFYYSFTMLLDIFMIVAKHTDQKVLQTAFGISSILGFITTLIYLRAVLCIPKQTN